MADYYLPKDCIKDMKHYEKGLDRYMTLMGFKNEPMSLPHPPTLNRPRYNPATAYLFLPGKS